MTASAPSTPPQSSRRNLGGDGEKVTKKASPDSRASRSAKAWSTDDERTLLTLRNQRVPYKVIGARLGKTDLACRLHFHQMLMAKRNPETQPGRSIVFLSSEHPPEFHRLAPPSLGPSAPSNLPAFSFTGDHSLPHTMSVTIGQLDDLPRHRRASSYSDGGSSSAWHPLASQYSGVDKRRGSLVDFERLNSIYREHAGDFWTVIATKYAGTQLSASEVEQAFFAAQPPDEAIAHDIIHQAGTENVYASSPSRSIDNNLLRPPPPQHTRSDSNLSISGRCSVDALLNHARA